MPKSAKALVEEYQAIYARADREGRQLNQHERNQVADLVEAAQFQKSMEDLGVRLGAPSESVNFLDPMSWGGTPGERFVQSAGFKRLQGVDKSEGSQWSSGLIEVTSAGPGYEMKGTLLEGSVRPAPARAADSSPSRKLSPAWSRSCTSRSISKACCRAAWRRRTPFDTSPRERISGAAGVAA